MNKISIVAAVVLAATSSASLAADWRMAMMGGRSGTTEQTAHFVDVTSIKRAGSKVRFWEWTILETTPRIGADNWKSLIEADCSEQTYRAMARGFFVGSTPEGARGNYPSAVEYAIPDSVVALTIDAVCQGKIGASTIADPFEASRDFMRNR